MDQTLYRRPLPADAIAFSSVEGRRVFVEALASGGLDGYFPLAEQFHTQSDPAFCGLGSLVVALNALGIDPGRLWKGPWRWFAEDLLDCCVSLPEVRAQGLTLDELACLARCNGAEVELQRADEHDVDDLRLALTTACHADSVLIASYDRATLGQTGAGHFSPLAGHHAARDLTLVLDVARFKYPPHWLSVAQLWSAMLPSDSATGRARGWLVLRRSTRGTSLGYTLNCAGESWRSLATRLRDLIQSSGSATELAELVHALAPLSANLELRAPTAPAHREALATARRAMRAHPLYEPVATLSGERAEAVMFLLFAIEGSLAPALREKLGLDQTGAMPAALIEELDHLKQQVAALWQHAAIASMLPA
jgi:glutathione gamma-glutamylcysteinyltransferase